VVPPLSPPNVPSRTKVPVSANAVNGLKINIKPNINIVTGTNRGLVMVLLLDIVVWQLCGFCHIGYV
jgi:hypothetical protein